MSSTLAEKYEVVVTETIEESEGVKTLILRRTDGQALPAFSAGAHIEVELPNGLVRPYSLVASSSGTRSYRISVLRSPTSRGGSRFIHEDLTAGAVLRAHAPRNLFPLELAPHRAVLFAGGIGITPILSMACELHAKRQDFQLHYAARTSACAAYLAQLASSPFADRCHFHFSNSNPLRDADFQTLLGGLRAQDRVYVCGPGGMIERVRTECRVAGLPDDAVVSEKFAPEAGPGASSPFYVKLASSGRLIQIGSDRSIVGALRDSGIEIPVSCEQGICGTCMTRVLSGTPDHRDSFLTDEEKRGGQHIMPCCSRSHSDVIEIDI